jgi:two-component system, NarL family, sensor histidine kinase FusK
MPIARSRHRRVAAKTDVHSDGSQLSNAAGRRRVLTDGVHLGLLAALYFGTAKLGLSLDAVSGFATAVWPPAGLALGALVLWGSRLWPGIALGAFCVNVSAGAPVVVAAGMAAGNTLEALLGTYFLRRLGFSPALERLQDVGGLVVHAAAFSTLVSATIGVSSGWLGGVIASPHYVQAWSTWWLGDLVSVLVVAPLVFSWTMRPRRYLSPRRTAELGAWFVCLGAISLLVFGNLLGTHKIDIVYLFFPLLSWAALRFGSAGAATATGLVSIIAIWGTAQGLGPFVHETLQESFRPLQAFMGIAAVSSLVFAAAVTEHHRAVDDWLRRQHLEAFARQIVEAQEAERRHLARELHDEIGQMLTGLRLLLHTALRAPSADAAERLGELQALVQDLIERVRDLARELRPPMLDDLGLLPALEDLFERYTKQTGIQVAFEHTEGEEPMAPAMETAVYRIVQEALTNVARHAGVREARVWLWTDAETVGVQIEDHGCGFDPRHTRGTSGLSGMRERAAALGGQLMLESSPGRGTCIRATWPRGR